jgi:hypothetical protein
MARFAQYEFRGQLGDFLVFTDLEGTERRVGFKIIDVALNNSQPRYVVCLTAGAWVGLNDLGEFCPLSVPVAEDDIGALTAFLAGLRRMGTVFDQVDQPSL